MGRQKNDGPSGARGALPVWLSHSVITVAALVIVMFVRGRIPVERYSMHPVTSSVAIGVKPVAIESTGVERFSVVTVIHAWCDRCRAIVQALKDIMAACASRPGASRVLILAIDSLPDTQAFIQEVGLKPDRILSFPRSNTLDIRSVPATFALDSGSRIVGVWPGNLSAKTADAISQRCKRQSVTEKESTK